MPLPSLLSNTSCDFVPKAEEADKNIITRKKYDKAFDSNALSLTLFAPDFFFALYLVDIICMLTSELNQISSKYRFSASDVISSFTRKRKCWNSDEANRDDDEFLKSKFHAAVRRTLKGLI